jgi:hypothetical protein
VNPIPVHTLESTCTGRAIEQISAYMVGDDGSEETDKEVSEQGSEEVSKPE